MDNKNYVKIAIGPLLFIIALLIPQLGPISARGGFGTLFWLAWYWVSGAIPLSYTWVVPFLAAAFVPIAPMPQIIQAYAHKFVLLIASTIMIASAWIRWGVAKRIALNALIFAGNNVKAQVLFWFWLSVIVSLVVADTITAVAFAPVAGSILYAVGYETTEDRWKSSAASALLIAVAWGSSHGGFATPLGSGAALVVFDMIAKVVGHPIPFISWTIRMTPFILISGVVISLYMMYIMKYDVKEFAGSKEHYRNELTSMGRWSLGEKISLWGFVIGLLLVFFQPVYRNLLPYRIEPTSVFFVIAIIMFLIPTETGEKVLNPGILKKHFPIVAIIIWPTAVALAKIMKISGATKVIASMLGPLAAYSPFSALAGFTGLGTLLTQFSSNTSACAITTPIVISAMQGAGQNPIPWALATGLCASFGYAVVSATGGMAVTVAFGGNIKTMFKHGLIIAALVWIVNLILWYLIILVWEMPFFFRI